MCFYLSVAIKTEKDDHLEVLGQNQIVNIFPWDNGAGPLYVKVSVKWLIPLFWYVRRTDVFTDCM